MSTGLQAGAATDNITPWLGISIPGSFRPQYAEDVDDELLAKALVIDNGETRVAIVTCDLIAMPQKVVDSAKARIADRYFSRAGDGECHAYAHGRGDCRSAGGRQGYELYGVGAFEDRRCGGAGCKAAAPGTGVVCQCGGVPDFILPALAYEGQHGSNEPGTEQP